MPGDPSLRESLRTRTSGLTVQPDDTATASLENPVLNVFPMSLTEALAEHGVLSLKSLWAELAHLR